MNSFVIDKRPIALVVLYNPKKQNLENLSHLSLDINIVGWNNSAVDIRHIENKFGNKFYIPSEWEGSFLFKNPAPIADKELVKRAYVYAGGSRNSDGFLKNKEKVDSYNKQFNDNIEFIDPFFKNSYGKKNSAYISLVSDAQWCFENIRLSEIRECFEFTDEVKNTDHNRDMS